MPERVAIFDTTLRDGEQAPGIALNVREKVEIAEQLARLGVDVVEAGFPASSPGELEAVREIARRVEGPSIAALARCVPGDIDAAWEALSPAPSPRIHVFLATSPVHMEHKLRMTGDQVLAAIRDGVRRAGSYTNDVEFSAEDATRSDPEFLIEAFRIAAAEGATVINVPDTVGYALPHEFGELVARVRESLPDHITVSVHCHDDLGLAVANSLAGVRAGARQVEVAANGIGERAGNCSLEEVLMILATRDVGVATDAHHKEIARTSRLVSMLTGYPVQPNKAVVGANAFAHESGIHQHGVLMNRETYEIMNAEDIGNDGSRIVLGKHSGRHAFVEALRKLGFELDADALGRAFARFKDLADRKISLSDADLEAIVADQLGDAESEVFRLESMQVAGGTHLSPTATVRVRRDGRVVEESALGDGMIDAAWGAIQRAVGVQARLEHFGVSSVTGGSDALGDVVVQLEVDGRVFTGRGISADVVEASARAFISAVNRAVRAGAAEGRHPEEAVA
ncbi:MAG: 2-isopropylmalate synthase [Actinomycetota bacterium]